MVQTILSGERLNDNQWSVDWRERVPGAFGQAGTVPHGRSLECGGGPAERRERTARDGVHRISSGLRVVDGGGFRGRCGAGPVAGCRSRRRSGCWRIRGFGGERSRGWGRSETPEFVEGSLPGMIIEIKPGIQRPVAVSSGGGAANGRAADRGTASDGGAGARPNPPMEAAKADDGVAEPEAAERSLTVAARTVRAGDGGSGFRRADGGRGEGSGFAGTDACGG